MNARIRALSLALSWIIPYVLFAKIIKIDDQTFCRFMMSDGSMTIFNSFGIVLLYVFPLVTIIALYVMIIRALKKTPNVLKGHEDAKRRKQNHRIVKILISLVFAFFICWTPLCVYFILKKLHPSLFFKDNCLFLAGFSFYVFPSLSTAVNPVILFVFSTNYNQALRTLCPALFCTCKCTSRVKQLSCLVRIVTKPSKNLPLKCLSACNCIFEEIQLEPDQESAATQTVNVEMTDIKRTCQSMLLLKYTEFF